MDQLSDYLSGSFRDEVRDRERTEDLAGKVLATFLNSFQNGRWPYLLRDGINVDAPRTYSFSTNVMILHALAAAAAPIRDSVVAAAIEGRLVKDRSCLSSTAFVGGVRLLYKKLQKADSALTSSATFGDDDPLTLSRLVELDGVIGGLRDSRDKPIVDESILTSVRKKIAKAIRLRLLADPAGAFEVTDSKNGDNPRAESLEHAFPRLALQHMATAQVRWLRGLEKARSSPWITASLQQAQLDERVVQKGAISFFHDRLHYHLSASQLKEGGFDAAELVLSLEGLIRCSASSPHPDIVSRVLTVLAEKQAESPYWRTQRPFLASAQGMVLVPISVEIANALVRVCHLLDSRDRAHRAFADSILLLRRYFDWLLARTRSGTTGDGVKYRGWHSEHIGKDDSIHLWETSQVLLFFAQYRGALRRHIAQTFLERSYVSASAVPRRYGLVHWDAEVARKEPMQGIDTGSPYRVLRRLRDNYLETHLASPGELKRRYSALLYGPPGTGKSTIAEDLAKCLGYQLVIVTPSDFLASGPADVERRAKELFQGFQWLSETVILLDEIDHFLLDRESDLYRAQSGIFQFLTPGMLTKLRDLHASKRPIFLIATNFAERIDPAIKRLGRIDDRLAVLCPDSVTRKAVISKACSEEEVRLRNFRVDGRTIAIRRLQWQAELDKVIDGTRLFVFGELMELIRIAVSLLNLEGSTRTFGEELVEATSRITPAITLPAYAARFPDPTVAQAGSAHPQLPSEEFLLVAYVACERKWLQESSSARWLSPSDIETLRHVMKCCCAQDGVDLSASAGKSIRQKAFAGVLERRLEDKKIARDLASAVDKALEPQFRSGKCL